MNKITRIATRHGLLLFVLITVIQVTVIVFWGTKKENLYWDEFFTLERAHYYSSANPGEHYIDVDPEFKVGEWLPVSFVKDTLIVGEEESLLNEPFLVVINKLTKTHNYSAFLNIAESILTSGTFSIWPAIILNILFFVLNQIVLAATCLKLSKDRMFALVVCSLYGVCSMCISMTVFVRFYMLVTLFVSLFTFLHLCYYESDGEKMIDRCKRAMFLLLAFGSLYLAHMNAQYSVVYGGILVLIFSFLLLIQKGVKRLLYYVVPMVGGGLIYLYTQTVYLHILFDFKGAYSDASGALGSTLDGIAGFELSSLPGKLLDIAHILGKYLFGSFYFMVAIAIVLLITGIANHIKGKDENENYKLSPFVIVSCLSALLYIVIFTVFGLYEQVRYISFVFPQLALLVVATIFTVFRSGKYRIICSMLLVFVTFIGVNAKGKVDMIYSGDRQSIENVRALGIDSYLLDAGNHQTFITYETTIFAQENDEFYVYNDLDPEGKDELSRHLRDKMVIVGYAGVSTEDLQGFLTDNGYQIEWVADTYSNVFFSAVRN